MATKTQQEMLEDAKSLDDFVEILGEENVYLLIKRAIVAKETSRLAHKKNYLKKQAILKKAIAQGLDKEV